jgi:hypothetical protein
MCKREPPRASHLLFIANRNATSRYTHVKSDRRSHAKATDDVVSRPSHLCEPRVHARSKPTVEFAFDRRVHRVRDQASVALTDVVQRALQHT